MEFDTLNDWLKNFEQAKVIANFSHTCVEGKNILSDTNRQGALLLFNNIVSTYTNNYDCGRDLMNCLIKYLFIPMSMQPTPLLNKEVMHSFLFINLSMLENDVKLLDQQLEQSTTNLEQFNRMIEHDCLLKQPPFINTWPVVDGQDTHLYRLVYHASSLIERLRNGDKHGQWDCLLSVTWRKQQIELFIHGMTKKNKSNK